MPEPGRNSIPFLPQFFHTGNPSSVACVVGACGGWHWNPWIMGPISGFSLAPSRQQKSVFASEQRRKRELAWDATWTLLGSTGGEVFPEVRKGSLCSLASPGCALNLPSHWPWLSNSSLSVPSFPVCTIYTWPAAGQPLW